MGEYPQNKQRARIKLTRAADGRLRSAAAGQDIGDVWAEQKRIRLKEAIDEDQKKAAKQGNWRKRFARKDFSIIPEPPKNTNGASKVVEIKISLPSKLTLPKLPKLRLPKILPKIPKRTFIMVAAAVLVVAAGAYAGVRLLSDQPAEVAQTTPETLGATNQQPEYDTILPAGKSIEDLGGWGRVSPPDKEPVFAYVDNIGGVQINVSQQPLPESFKQDVAAEVAKVAEQFKAHEKLSAGDDIIYIGTSANGPQSVVLAKDDLLILMKSASKLRSQQWAEYVMALQ